MPECKMEKVENFHLCNLSFSEVLYTLDIIIKDTGPYTALFVWGTHINTNALILTQYLIVTLKGHELLLLQKIFLKVGGGAVIYKYCLKDI